MNNRKMKNSGIAWVGEIPQEWEMRKGKYIFKQRNEKGNNIELQLLSPTQNYGVIPQANYEKLSGMNAVKLNEGTNFALLKTIHKGDYCISLRSFQGGFEYSQYEGVVSPAYQVFYPIVNISRDYYKFLFKEKRFIEVLNSYTMSLRDGKNIAFDDFGNTYIPVPSLDEQQRIADFLDEWCEKIDELKADIVAQIDTLEQYKRSVITEAVTHGLTDAPMKDSGIGWIPVVPKHWRLEKLKYNLCQRGVKNQIDKQVLSLYREYGLVPKDSRDDNHNVTSENVSAYRYVRVGDFVVNKMKAWQGSVAVSNYEGIVSPAYFVYEFVNKDIDKKYFHYLIRNKTYATEFRRLSGGIREGQWDLPAEALNNTYILIPPIDEQKAIAEYLDKKCAEIEQIIADKKAQLDTLDDYKKSLIYEYVTGKKEVK